MASVFDRLFKLSSLTEQKVSTPSRSVVSVERTSRDDSTKTNKRPSMLSTLTSGSSSRNMGSPSSASTETTRSSVIFDNSASRMSTFNNQFSPKDATPVLARKSPRHKRSHAKRSPGDGTGTPLKIPLRADLVLQNGGTDDDDYEEEYYDEDDEYEEGEEDDSGTPAPILAKADVSLTLQASDSTGNLLSKVSERTRAVDDEEDAQDWDDNN